MALRGVRSSWLMEDRNSLLAVLARSASRLACSRARSARRRSLMSWAKALTVVSGPAPTAQITTSTGNRRPSLCTAVTSTRRFSSGPSPVSRYRRRPRSWASRDASGTISSARGRPTVSAPDQPKVASA
jgi:hypothetical protein